MLMVILVQCTVFFKRVNKCVNESSFSGLIEQCKIVLLVARRNKEIDNQIRCSHIQIFIYIYIAVVAVAGTA